MNRKQRRAAGERGPLTQHPTVQLAYIHPGEVSAVFMASVVRCRDYEVQRTQQLFALLERKARSGSIAKARNEVTTMFLRGDIEWLWFIDADMGFPSDALHKMLAVAHPEERPIVGALAFALSTDEYEEETNADYFEYQPTIHVWDNSGEDGATIGFKIVYDYPRDAVIQCDSTGAACVLIHRSVLETMRDEFGDHWWTQIQHPVKNEPFGEDTSFYLRAAKVGYPLIVHTGVRTSHDKGGVFLTERLYDEQRVIRDVKKQMEELDGKCDGELGTASSEEAPEHAGRTGLGSRELLSSGPDAERAEQGDLLTVGSEVVEDVGDAGNSAD